MSSRITMILCVLFGALLFGAPTLAHTHRDHALHSRGDAMPATTLATMPTTAPVVRHASAQHANMQAQRGHAALRAPALDACAPFCDDATSACQHNCCPAAHALTNDAPAPGLRPRPQEIIADAARRARQTTRQPPSPPPRG